MTRMSRIVKAAAIVLALAAAPVALAEHNGGDRGHGRRHWVPEFDPAAGGAVAALLAGGGLLIASRRKNRK